jgi:hypothetical protein
MGSPLFISLGKEYIVARDPPKLSLNITHNNQCRAWMITDKPDWKINRNVPIVLMNSYKVFFSLIEINWAKHSFLGILCYNLFHVLLLTGTVIWQAGKLTTSGRPDSVSTG